MKSLREAAKILVAGRERVTYPPMPSTSQRPTNACICGRPHPEGHLILPEGEGASGLVENSDLIVRLERRIEELGEERAELAKAIGRLLAEESELRRRVKALKK